MFNYLKNIDSLEETSLVNVNHTNINWEKKLFFQSKITFLKIIWKLSFQIKLLKANNHKSLHRISSRKNLVNEVVQNMISCYSWKYHIHIRYTIKLAAVTNPKERPLLAPFLVKQLLYSSSTSRKDHSPQKTTFITSLWWFLMQVLHIDELLYRDHVFQLVNLFCIKL